MKRRAPGHLAVSPLRGWSGAIVAITSLTTIVFAGGVADAGRPPSLTNTVAELAGITTADIDTDATAEAVGTYAVRTIAVEFYDVHRDRYFVSTVHAPVTTSAAGPFPLVVFVHGYAATAANYDQLSVELASAGFIVAAPDFPRSSSAAASSPTRDIVAQAADVSFVLDVLLSPSSEPSALVGAISRGPVAVVGHSDGGVTAALLHTYLESSTVAAGRLPADADAGAVTLIAAA